MARVLRQLTALLALVALVSCGSNSPSSPSPNTSRFALQGTVFADNVGLAGAHVDVVSGANVGRGATTDATGRYTIAELAAGTMTVRASASGYADQTVSVTLGGNQTTNFALVAAEKVTIGRVVDVLSQAPYAGISMSGDGLASSTSDATGAFSLVPSNASADPRPVTFTGPGVVTRRTSIRVPGADPTVTLISSSFDLASFNQMLRVPMLLRWTTAPPLVVETRALRFTDINATDQVALADQMSDAEIAGLVADLTWALPQMTGGSYPAFAGVTVQSSAENASVHLLNSGVIFVSRVVGLTAATGFWGYSRWQWRTDGSISGGIVTLDRDFERSGSEFLRSLRSHELGHALGYNHVTLRPSVMNSAARIEPNDFDLAAFRIAFARSPGNTAPDVDPSTASLNRLSLTATWSPPIR